MADHGEKIHLVCEVCHSTEFERFAQEGVYVCKDCGTQSQVQEVVAF